MEQRGCLPSGSSRRETRRGGQGWHQSPGWYCYMSPSNVRPSRWLIEALGKPSSVFVRTHGGAGASGDVHHLSCTRHDFIFEIFRFLSWVDKALSPTRQAEGVMPDTVRFSFDDTECTLLFSVPSQNIYNTLICYEYILINLSSLRSRPPRIFHSSVCPMLPMLLLLSIP